jgi:hypothetical protein
MTATRWIAAVGVLLVIAACRPETSHESSHESSRSSSSRNTSKAVVKITASDGVCWTGRIGHTERSGCGSVTVRNVKGQNGTINVKLRKTKGSGTLTVRLIVGGKTVDRSVVRSSSVVTVDNRR